MNIINNIDVSKETKNYFKNLEYKNNYSEITSINPSLETLSEMDLFKGSKKMRKYAYLIHYEMPLIRKIRGDGNCFYRSFGFQYMEKILLHENQEHFLRMMIFIDSLQAIEISEFCIKSSINNIQQNLMKIKKTLLDNYKILFNIRLKEKRHWQKKISHNLAELFNKIELFDAGNIIIFRILAWKIYEVFKNDEKLDENFSMNLIGCEDQLKDIKKYATEAELIVLALYPRLLNIRLKIFYAEPKNNQKDHAEPIEMINEGIAENYLIPIFLYFRPGHYDMGYDKKFAVSFYKEITIKNYDYNFNDYMDKNDLEEITEKNKIFEINEKKKVKSKKKLDNDYIKNQKILFEEIFNEGNYKIKLFLTF